MQKRKGHADHHPSLPVQPLLKNRLQILRVIVNILLDPLLVTRNQRNATRSRTRSPSRRCAHRYQGIRRSAMICWSAGYVSRDAGVYCLPVDFLFFFQCKCCFCFLIKFHIEPLLVVHVYFVFSAPNNQHSDVCFVSMCMKYQVNRMNLQVRMMCQQHKQHKITKFKNTKYTRGAGWVAVPFPPPHKGVLPPGN